MKLYKPIIFLCTLVVLFCGSSMCVPSGASERPTIEPDTNLSDQEPPSYTNLSGQEPPSNAKQPTIIELPKSLKQYLSQLESNAPNCIITCDGKVFNVNVGRYPTIETFDQWLQYSIKYEENKDRNILNIICCALQFAHNNMSDFNKHKYMIWPSVENINFNTDQDTEIYTFPKLLSAIRLGGKKEVLLLILKFAHNNTPLFNDHKEIIFSLMRIIFNKSHPLRYITIEILFSAHGLSTNWHTLFAKALSEYEALYCSVKDKINKYRCSVNSAYFESSQKIKDIGMKRNQFKDLRSSLQSTILAQHAGIWLPRISEGQDFINVINFVIKNIIVCTHEELTIEINRETFEFKLAPEKIDIAVEYALQSLESLHKLMSYFMEPEYAREKICTALEKAYGTELTFV